MNRLFIVKTLEK